MPRYSQLFLFLSLFCCLEAQAQEEFYQQDHIAEIRLYFSQSNWQHKLDSIFVATNGNDRMTANVKIDGNFYQNVGVRYKGFSSWNLGELKNPFNIELDYFIKNQNHKGFTKIKLSNVIYDPSFIREVLSYEIVRKYMPASHAGYANLYVNDQLIGLYSNIESVDPIFLSRYYPEHKNSFIKGEPAQLQFPFGDNANLAHTHGNDSLNYMPYYKLESDFGWKDLYHFIYILNEKPDSIEQVLNTDRTLWMHALNYSLLNLDSYIGYSQNYYIYKDENGRFNPVIWDLNMSFGSFRNSDASTHFQGLSIAELKTLDPLQHLSFSVSPRPLMKNLFLYPVYKRMYLAHMRTILDENIRNNWYLNRGLELMQTIRTAVQQDTNKFYSNTDFENNLTITVGGTGGMSQYPGIQDLMDDRIAYLDTYPGFAGAPLISNILSNPPIAEKGKASWITAQVESANHVVLAFRYGRSDVFIKTAMLDDGAHHDGLAGDGIYGVSIDVNSSSIQYYIYAENDSAGRFSPERAEYEFYTLMVEPEKGDFCFNEIYVDDYSHPWLEFLNTTSNTISLKGLSLITHLPDTVRWSFPDTILTARSFLMLQFSSDSINTLNCKWSLPATGGNFYLINTFGHIVDHINYPTQISGKSFGRYPNGYGPFVYMLPTYAKNNLTGSTPQTSFISYPSPAESELYIEFMALTGNSTIDIYNLLGQKVLEDNIHNNQTEPYSTICKYDISSLSSGPYFICLRNKEQLSTKKFLKH